MRLLRNGTEIRTLDDWHAAMPPRLRDRQWRADRVPTDVELYVGKVQRPE